MKQFNQWFCTIICSIAVRNNRDEKRLRQFLKFETLIEKIKNLRLNIECGINFTPIYMLHLR